MNLFSELIGGDRSPTIITSNGSFCIIDNTSSDANNLKTAQLSTIFHPQIVPNSPKYGSKNQQGNTCGVKIEGADLVFSVAV
ncbi:hypothetical protein [Microcoleus sp. N3A4]|uniref:hypothetical protein n=1 Tax=Microcoleus sp. N3A4 TaxID=3055379 RepID=UPI002FD11528